MGNNVLMCPALSKRILKLHEGNGLASNKLHYIRPEDQLSPSLSVASESV